MYNKSKIISIPTENFEKNSFFKSYYDYKYIKYKTDRRFP